MPYPSTRDLPPAVRKLPEKAQRQFLHVFNSEYARHGETVAFKAAWSAVRTVRRAKRGRSRE